VTLNFGEMSVVKSRPSIPCGANFLHILFEVLYIITDKTCIYIYNFESYCQFSTVLLCRYYVVVIPRSHCNSHRPNKNPVKLPVQSLAQLT